MIHPKTRSPARQRWATQQAVECSAAVPGRSPVLHSVPRSSSFPRSHRSCKTNPTRRRLPPTTVATIGCGDCDAATMPRMASLLIKITKRTDGGYVIACERRDGTVTWQKGTNAMFFPLHDLRHFAVETEMRHRRGFFGLVAEGWEFTDFGKPWPRGPIPADADPSELIVGLLDSERIG